VICDRGVLGGGFGGIRRSFLLWGVLGEKGCGCGGGNVVGCLILAFIACQFYGCSARVARNRVKKMVLP